MLSSRKICVVIADDQDDERLRVASLLRDQGMQVLDAKDGGEAVSLVKRGGVDLAILDAYMPGVNGFLALKTIIQDMRDKAPPVLLVIPNATPKETSLAMKLGARGHLTPPYDPQVLVERARQLTGSEPAPTLQTMSQRPALTLTESRARDEIVRRVEQLPALPLIVQELIRKVSDPGSRTSELEEIIQRDQSLAARVLKLVNSSYFRGQREIRSIGDAVVRLGRNTIQSLALASSTSKAMPGNNEVYGFRPGGLWLHSFAVASAARAIAHEAAGEEEANRAFLGGLLHDVGKLILGMMIEKRRAEFDIALRETDHVSQAEARVFFHTHAEVGDMIGDRWKFPPEIREIIRNHHRPARGGETDTALLAVICANTLVNRVGLGLLGASGPVAAVANATSVAGGAEFADVPPPSAAEAEWFTWLGLSADSIPAFEATAREAARVFEVYVEA